MEERAAERIAEIKVGLGILESKQITFFNSTKKLLELLRSKNSVYEDLENPSPTDICIHAERMAIIDFLEDQVQDFRRYNETLRMLEEAFADIIEDLDTKNIYKIAEVISDE